MGDGMAKGQLTMGDIETIRAELRGQLKAALAAVESARKVAEESGVPVLGAITRIGFDLVDAIAKAGIAP
jgi:hypothetical protein